MLKTNFFILYILYTVDETSIYNLLNCNIPNFSFLSKGKKNLNILIDYLYANVYLHVQVNICVNPNQYILSGKFITLCCRFSGRENN